MLDLVNQAYVGVWALGFNEAKDANGILRGLEVFDDYVDSSLVISDRGWLLSGNQILFLNKDVF